MTFGILLTIPALTALFLYASRGVFSSRTQGSIAAAVAAVSFIYAASQVPAITAAPAEFTQPWISTLNLSLSLYVDGLSLLFVLLVTGIGAAIFFYTGFYFNDSRESGRFLSILLLFTSSMLALVTAGNLFTLFIAWELTSITSFLLIGFKGKEGYARSGALQALMITGGGGLAMFGGLALMAYAGGSAEFSQILSAPEILQSSPLISAIALLLMIGAFSKSAQFPLHFWLPNAMSAPTPASAFLHSATMVKAGVFLLLRVQPVLVGTPIWDVGVPLIGLTTLFVGVALALRQRDLKGNLAYSTISQLGALVALVGFPNGEGIKPALVGLVAHALYKSALFLVVGAVDHAAGTRDWSKLGGLRNRMPWFALATGIAALSMAGIPPLLGFVGKEQLLEAAIHVDTLSLIVVLISSAFTVTMAFLLYSDIFMGKPRSAEVDAHFHEVPKLMVVGPLALGIASLLTGLLIKQLVQPIVSAAMGEQTSLYLFAEGIINEPLILSIIAVGAGVGLYLIRDSWRPALMNVRLPSAAAAYNMTIKAIDFAGDTVLRTQNGRIRFYLTVILATVIGMVALTTGSALAAIPPIEFSLTSALDVLRVCLILLSIGATIASIVFKRHLIAALSLGISGYAIGGLFLLEPAPDVALVQFLVETIGAVLIILILSKTSEVERQHAIETLWGNVKKRSIGRDAVISILIALGVTLLALTALNSRPTPQTVALWHIENSYAETGATDVVASIVTDFRGMDTVIEITVFSLAALGVLTLLATPEFLRGRRPESSQYERVRRIFRQGRRVTVKEDLPPDLAIASPESQAKDEQLRLPVSRFSNPLTRFITNLVLPVALLIAISHMLYGGGAPGDGFTAGVIGGLAIALWYLVYGYNEVRTRLRWMHPPVFIGLGLVLAVGNAFFPMLFGEPFLAHNAYEGYLPAGLKFSSTLIFEIAIFLAVFGGVSAIMEAITHPREVEAL